MAKAKKKTTLKVGLKRRKDSKTQKIIAHLLSHKQINTVDAIRYYSAHRLAVIVCNLRAKGWKINTVSEVIKDTHGNSGIYAKYVFVALPKTKKIKNKKIKNV